ncbi:B12-binding domain-containing radical SAM protein [Thermodesulfobacteriota bacterium]
MSVSTVLLEHPRIESAAHFNDVANAPLSACLMSGSIAALLQRHGHAVQLCESYLRGDSFEECFERLDGMRCDLLGVHAVYFWEHTPELFSFLERLRAAGRSMPIVLYGFFPTQAHARILELFSCVDAVILGEPEETFLELVDALQRRGSFDAGVAAGVACREGGRVVRGAQRALVSDLDGLPFPIRSELFLSRLGGQVLGSRGCPGACSFCCINPFYGCGPGWRGRTAASISAELEALLPRLQRKYVYFLDASFFVPGSAGRARRAEMAEMLGGHGIEFGLECRATDIDEQIVSCLARAGLRDVFLGVESVSATALKRMRKRIDRSKSRRAIELLRDCGIEPSLGFIMFGADTTLAEVRENFTFLQNGGLLTRLSNTADVLYHRQIVLQGAPDFARYAEAGRLAGRDALGYEGRYRFADPSVQLLADLMARACRFVLRRMGQSGSAVFWDRGQTPVAGRVNEYLAGLFETVLCRLERQELALSDDVLMAIEAEALCRIEGLLGETTVCQCGS